MEYNICQKCPKCNSIEEMETVMTTIGRLTLECCNCGTEFALNLTKNTLKEIGMSYPNYVTKKELMQIACETVPKLDRAGLIHFLDRVLKGDDKIKIRKGTVINNIERMKKMEATGENADR